MKNINYLFLALLAGCSGIYKTSTNLDKKNFENYFAASNVNIYQDEKKLPSNHQLVGLVEGQDCQLKPHLAAPNKINARTQAREKAHLLNANGIIFSQCATIEDQQCHALLICYGKAYQVFTDE